MTQAGLWVGAGCALTLSLAAGLADWRRARRHDIDAVGWVPWGLVQVLALFAAAICAILAMRG